jgi:hypothetical protein
MQCNHQSRKITNNEEKVEPIKRKLAWETTEEGTTTISHRHVHDFFQQSEDKKLMMEGTKRMMPIMGSTSSTGAKKRRSKQMG